MSLNKQAHIRYMVIDQLLRKEDGVFINEIIRECKRAIAYATTVEYDKINLSKRTIQDDLKFFRETYGADIIQERRDVPDSKQSYIESKSKLNTYRFKDSSFSISNLPINKKERESLLEALGVLYRLSFMKSFSWLKETISELQLIRSEGIPNEEIISFEESPLLKGIEYLKPAYDSILRKQALEIKYFSYNKNMEFNFTVSPYFLKQYNKRWFLFGRSHEFILENPDRLLNLPLDRIISLNAYDVAFIPNQGLSPSEYFKDIIGVTFDEKANKEDVLIKVKSEHFHYIESKPFHSSQIVIEKEKDWVLIQISVVPNVELESQILARGEFLVVISPIAFRNKIMHRVKKISENY